MYKKIIATTALFLFFIQGALADSPPAPTQLSQDAPTTMQRDEWLSYLQNLLPEVVCKGFISNKDIKKRLESQKITYEQCLSLIPASGKKCTDAIYPRIPEIVNENGATIYGQMIGECIGKDFAEKYLVPKG